VEVILCHGCDVAGHVVFFLGCVGICHHGGGGLLVAPIVGRFVCCCVLRGDPQVWIGYLQVPYSIVVGSVSLLVRAVSVN
jgi:hypothetical protein